MMLSTIDWMAFRIAIRAFWKGCNTVSVRRGPIDLGPFFFNPRNDDHSSFCRKYHSSSTLSSIGMRRGMRVMIAVRASTTGCNTVSVRRGPIDLGPILFNRRNDDDSSFLRKYRSSTSSPSISMIRGMRVTIAVRASSKGYNIMSVRRGSINLVPIFFN